MTAPNYTPLIFALCFYISSGVGLFLHISSDEAFMELRMKKKMGDDDAFIQAVMEYGAFKFLSTSLAIIIFLPVLLVIKKIMMR